MGKSEINLSAKEKDMKLLSEQEYQALHDRIAELEQQVAELSEERPPHKTFTPKVRRDGNEWCALYGDNLQDGVCGFGDTPAEAVQAFDQAWIGARA